MDFKILLLGTLSGTVILLLACNLATTGKSYQPVDPSSHCEPCEQNDCECKWIKQIALCDMQFHGGIWCGTAFDNCPDYWSSEWGCSDYSYPDDRIRCMDRAIEKCGEEYSACRAQAYQWKDDCEARGSG